VVIPRDRGFDLIAQKIAYVLGTRFYPQCSADFQVPEIILSVTYVPLWLNLIEFCQKEMRSRLLLL
jgi:hypothetical protein